jgi:hypothetical protein
MACPPTSSVKAVKATCPRLLRAGQPKPPKPCAVSTTFVNWYVCARAVAASTANSVIASSAASAVRVERFTLDPPSLVYSVPVTTPALRKRFGGG